MLLNLAMIVIGWVMGGRRADNQKALAQNTLLRNMGPGLVIASSQFPGTAASPVMIAATLVNGAVGYLAATWWARSSKAGASK